VAVVMEERLVLLEQPVLQIQVQAAVVVVELVA
jgi:hypothetical protein